MTLRVLPGKPSKLKDWAYDVIKVEILNFRVSPGAQLHIHDLTEQMDISRTPIREALLWLENDGLVRAVPRVGFFVTEITKRDLQELFELRALLEGHAAEKATPLLSDDDLDQMDYLCEASVVAVERGDLNEFLKFEISFHSLLIERCGNRHLIEVMESLKDLTYRERILSLKSIENAHESCFEHQRLLDALHKRNAQLAGRRMREHMYNARHRLVQLVDLPG